jgi:hypothetical protein
MPRLQAATGLALHSPAPWLRLSIQSLRTWRYPVITLQQPGSQTTRSALVTTSSQVANLAYFHIYGACRHTHNMAFYAI